MKFTKIVTHLPPRHFDDFLAVSLLKSKFDIPVEFVLPQSVPAEYLEDPRIIVVDVGLSYDPVKNNYDHHQDKNLDCSLLLILRHFYGKLDFNEIEKKLSEVDKNGPLAEGKIDTAKKRTILLVDFNKYFREVTASYYDAINASSYAEFIERMYNNLDSYGVLVEAKRLFEIEVQDFERKMANVLTLNIAGLTVIFSNETLAPYHGLAFSKTGADIIVERNQMHAGHTSVIRNSLSLHKDKIDFRRLAEKYNLLFLHPNGFLAVLDIEVEKFNLGDLILVKIQ